MNVLTEIAAAARWAGTWLQEDCFPLWAGAGRDPRGGFRERLALDGTGIDDADTRIRVQARQVFTFGLARRLGWNPGQAEAAIEAGLEVLLADGRREDGLFGRRLIPGGGLADETADLYDNAFVLLAFSEAARLEGPTGTDALKASKTLISAIMALMTRPGRNAGYCEILPPEEVRAQNPHMHLFEALLASEAVMGDGSALGLARDIGAFLLRHHMDAGTGRLRELTGPSGEPLSEDRYEAGHHYEWVWLLHEYERLAGEVLEDGLAARLYDSALGLTGADGRVALSHTLEGAVREPVHRTWVLTEALKAHIARARAGDGQALARIAPTFERLHADHLTGAARGGWMDRLDGSGTPLATDMPASTGYHVVLAFHELIAFSREGQVQTST